MHCAWIQCAFRGPSDVYSVNRWMNVWIYLVFSLLADVLPCGEPVCRGACRLSQGRYWFMLACSFEVAGSVQILCRAQGRSWPFSLWSFRAPVMINAFHVNTCMHIYISAFKRSTWSTVSLNGIRSACINPPDKTSVCNSVINTLPVPSDWNSETLPVPVWTGADPGRWYGSYLRYDLRSVSKMVNNNPRKLFTCSSPLQASDPFLNEKVFKLNYLTEISADLIKLTPLAKLTPEY
jgi:hypothetical protein